MDADVFVSDNRNIYSLFIVEMNYKLLVICQQSTSQIKGKVLIPID